MTKKMKIRLFVSIQYMKMTNGRMHRQTQHDGIDRAVYSVARQKSIGNYEVSLCNGNASET